MYSVKQIINGIRDPIGAFRFFFNRFQKKYTDPLVRKLNEPINGTRIMEEDWDNLIILDACRYDVFREVNSVPGTLHKRTSRGGATPAFIQENFANREFNDTVWISANAVVGQYSDLIDVYKLVGLWGDDTGNSEIEFPDDNTHPFSLTDPEPVVENAIKASESYPNKRLIIHFLQPHTPYLIKDGEQLPADSKYRTFTAVRNGEVSEAEMRSVYKQNVKFVMKHVKRLLNKLNGKTVITADHGELLGEGVPLAWRLLDSRWALTNLDNYDYAHYNWMRVSELIEVPWHEVAGGERRKIVETDDPEGVEMDESAIEQQLVALGYKDSL
jgi:hypothetical protein